MSTFSCTLTINLTKSICRYSLACIFFWGFIHILHHKLFKGSHWFSRFWSSLTLLVSYIIVCRFNFNLLLILCSSIRSNLIESIMNTCCSFVSSFLGHTSFFSSYILDISSLFKACNINISVNVSVIMLRWLIISRSLISFILRSVSCPAFLNYRSWSYFINFLLYFLLLEHIYFLLFYLFMFLLIFKELIERSVFLYLIFCNYLKPLSLLTIVNDIFRMVVRHII